MKKHLFTFLFFCFALCTGQEETVASQPIVCTAESLPKWEFQLRAGVSIGGVTPIPLPVQIRKVKKYNPLFNGYLEGIALRWIDTHWGISSGLRIEQKGMSTAAQMKNYYTTLISTTNSVQGYYTGEVATHYSSTLLTLPLLVHYKIASRWSVRAGANVSYMLVGVFRGEVREGYLREGSPVGERLIFEGDKKGEYNFSQQLSKFQWGMQCGVQWWAYPRLSVGADLLLGGANLFKKDFRTISFPMRPIYLSVGFGYKF